MQSFCLISYTFHIFFLVLKIIALTREVSTLQKKVEHAANSTERTTEISGGCFIALQLYILYSSVTVDTINSNIISMLKYLNLAPPA